MKKQAMYAMCMLLCVALCGCGQNDSDPPTESRADLFAESSAPADSISSVPNMESEPEDTAGYDALQSIGGGLTNREELYKFSGAPLTLNFQYIVDGSPSAGFLLLCNGQPVPYHTDRDSTDQLMHTVETNQNYDPDQPVEERWETITFTFTPTGKQGDNVDLQAAIVVDPAYDLDTLQPNEDDSVFWGALINGYKGDLFYSQSSTIEMEADGLTASESIVADAYVQEAVDAKTLQSWIYTDDFGMTHAGTEFLHAEFQINDSNPALYYACSKGDVFRIQGVCCGGSAAQMTASVYLNYELYPAFQGKEYAAFPVDDQQYTKFEAIIDTDDLAPGRYMCCLVISPYENKQSDLRSFVLDVKG